MSTWTTKAGLYTRYGQEFIDKLARRRDFDPDAGEHGAYVENENCERVNQVICTAIEDAKTWILWKLSCCFDIKEFNRLLEEGDEFSFIQTFHSKLSITFLKSGGDCQECDECKEEISMVCSCKQICSDNGICLPSTKRSRFSVEPTPASCWPENRCCSTCGPTGCSCGY